MAEILDVDGKLVFAWPEKTLAETVCIALARGFPLDGANLAGVDLKGTSLTSLYGANMRYADLSGAKLDRANLNGANLNGAKLDRASLISATMIEAQLSHASLLGATLRNALLCEVNLLKAKLLGADLYNADLTDAYLGAANLEGANLYAATLRGADMRGATYAVPQVLCAKWRQVSPELCYHLMQLDAECIPNGIALLDQWAKGGPCPLQRCHIHRAALFHERRTYWLMENPPDPVTMWELWVMLAKEKGVKISSDDRLGRPALI